MKIDLTDEQITEVKTALNDQLREVNGFLSYARLRPVSNDVLYRWGARKYIIVTILTMLEENANET